MLSFDFIRNQPIHSYYSHHLPRFFREVIHSGYLGRTEGLSGNSKTIYEVCGSKSEKSAPMQHYIEWTPFTLCFQSIEIGKKVFLTFDNSSTSVAQFGRAPTIQSDIGRLVVGSIPGRDLRERNFGGTQNHIRVVRVR